MFTMMAVMFAQQANNDTLSTAGIAAFVTAALGGMAALGTVLFKELNRKDTRADRISAEMLTEVRTRAERAEAALAAKEKESDEWERLYNQALTEKTVLQMRVDNLTKGQSGA